MAPMVFVSYAHSDDATDNRFVTSLAEALQRELHSLGSPNIDVFLDRTHIHPGARWKDHILKSLDQSMFLIPVLSPSYFRSRPCSQEVDYFRRREAELGRNDLILPIYYISHAPLENHRGGALVQHIAQRQYLDWRRLRNKSFGNAAMKKAITELATLLRTAISAKTQAATGKGNRQRRMHPGPDPSRELSIGTGLLNAWPRRAAWDRHLIVKQFEKAPHLDMVGYNLRNFWLARGSAFHELLRARLQRDRNLRVRILLADPEKKDLLFRREELEDGHEPVGRMFAEGATVLRDIWDLFPICITPEVLEVRLLDADLITSSMIFIEDRAYVTWYFATTTGNSCPTLELQDTPGGLYRAFQDEFDRLWAKGVSYKAE